MNREQAEDYAMQQSLQQQNIDGQNLGNAPMLQEQVMQNQAVLVEQTNPKKIVKNIILRLKGLEENMDGTTKSIAEPKMNKKGIDNIWFILDSHINQGVVLSHLDKTEIRNIIETISDDIVDDLALNWQIYGIIRKSDIDLINDSILINIYLALKRAEGQNEKNWLGKISVENISGQGQRMNMSSNKAGFWNKFKLN